MLNGRKLIGSEFVGMLLLLVLRMSTMIGFILELSDDYITNISEK
jgi:hypothetical protein